MGARSSERITSWDWEHETWHTLEGVEVGPRAHLLFFGGNNDRAARWLSAMGFATMGRDLLHVAVPVDRVAAVLGQLIQARFRPNLVDIDRGTPPVDVEVISEVATAVADVLGHDPKDPIHHEAKAPSTSIRDLSYGRVVVRRLAAEAVGSSIDEQVGAAA